MNKSTNMPHYNPIQINNPKSQHHLVRLQPGQDVQLCLNKSIFKNHRIQVSDDFIDVHQSPGNFESKFYYYISQNDITKYWCDHSCVFLGEVWIDSDSVSSKLIIVLESTNNFKANFLTVVNPYFADVRITPGDILEVVLFDIDDKKRHWSWSFDGENNFDVEMIGASELVFDRNNVSYEVADLPYSKIPRTSTTKGHTVVQHHMWFRFSRQLMASLSDSNTVHRLGELKFLGQDTKDEKCQNESEFSFNIFASLNDKYKMRILHSLLLPKLEDAQFQSSNFDNFAKNKNDTIMLNNVKVEIIKNSRLDFGCVTKPLSPFDYKNSNCSKENNSPYVVWDEECI